MGSRRFPACVRRRNRATEGSRVGGDSGQRAAQRGGGADRKGGWAVGVGRRN
jgi:hypothetical protein